MAEHRQALEYDCMTRTGRTVGEYLDMGRRGTLALAAFVRHLGPDSETWRECHEGDETPGWTTVQSTNAILADIYDAISALNANFVRANSKRKPKQPKPYPRPNARPAGGGVGSGDVRAADFEEWWESGE